jgi:signal transduction histidine kinase
MGKTLRKKHFVFLVYIFIFLTTLLGGSKKSYSQNINDKGFDVLVLNSYNPGHKWEGAILEGLESYIKENNIDDINFRVEYLDFRTNYNEKYIKSLKSMLKEKYPQGSIDAIYTVNSESYEVFSYEVLNEDSNFYKIPLVFSGVDGKSDGTKEEKKYMSGIYHGDDSLNLFSLINDLNPNMKTINLIIEDSEYGDSTKYEIDSLIDNYLKGQIEVRYIRSNYLDDIIDQLKGIKSSTDTINIIAGEFQCKDTRIYQDPDVVISEIKKYSDAPIYSNDQTYLNAGILGGHIDIGQEHAKIVCDMIVQIKNGISLENIEDTVEPVAKAYVDYNSVYEYNIDTFSIKKHVNIVNNKNNEILLPIYIKYILLMLLLIAIISIIIIIIWISKYRKKKIKSIEEHKKAKEREQLKSDFIVNLSHELRTPINIILGTTNVLERNVNNDVLDRNYILNKIENINQNSYRLLKISNNIIDITKAESGMLSLNLENCNIVNIIEDIFESSIDFARRKNINMIFDTNEEEIKTAIDVFQIQRVILNLISNAIKFTHEEGTINLSIWRSLENIIIEVKDNGIGIPRDKMDYIFYRFYQVENLYTRKNEGSGIGLCIVKEIIEIHNGRIEIESEESKGSMFRIYLPIKIDKELLDYDNTQIINNTKIVDLEMSDI